MQHTPAKRKLLHLDSESKQIPPLRCGMTTRRTDNNSNSKGNGNSKGKGKNKIRAKATTS